MELLEAIKSRRSVRSYTEENVSFDTIKILVEAAMCAPSAGNIQPWFFVIIRRKKIKEALSSAALNQRFIIEAPVVIVVCANTELSRRGYGDRGANLYCLQDTAAATQNLLLAALSFGLGTCWIGAFNEEKVRTILNIPEDFRPVSIVSVGHPAEKPTSRLKRPFSEVALHGDF